MSRTILSKKPVQQMTEEELWEEFHLRLERIKEIPMGEGFV